MLKFLTLAIKTQLNVHDLNNEAVAGNVTDIRLIDFIDENGQRKEAPGVSGRMLKHWHYEAMKNLIINGPYGQVPLCDGCKMGEPIRPGKIENGKLGQVAKPEIEAIIDCAVCDIHGYLIAQGARAEETEEETETEESRPKEKQSGISVYLPEEVRGQCFPGLSLSLKVKARRNRSSIPGSRNSNLWQKENPPRK